MSIDNNDNYNNNYNSATVPAVQLHRLEEGARRLSISRSHLYRMAELGAVRLVRVGSSVRISEDELRRLASGQPMTYGTGK